MTTQPKLQSMLLIPLIYLTALLVISCNGSDPDEHNLFFSHLPYDLSLCLFWIPVSLFTYAKNQACTNIITLPSLGTQLHAVALVYTYTHINTSPAFYSLITVELIGYHCTINHPSINNYFNEIQLYVTSVVNTPAKTSHT